MSFPIGNLSSTSPGSLGRDPQRGTTDRVMGLDIGAFPPGSPQGPPAVSVTLENDGYYWFLYELIEKLREETGLHLDLCGDATFTSAHLPRLRTFVTDAGELVESQPATFRVCVGKELGSNRELFDSVTKTEFRALLAGLRSVVDEAERLGGYVECVGD